MYDSRPISPVSLACPRISATLSLAAEPSFLAVSATRRRVSPPGAGARSRATLAPTKAPTKKPIMPFDEPCPKSLPYGYSFIPIPSIGRDATGSEAASEPLHEKGRPGLQAAHERDGRSDRSFHLLQKRRRHRSRARPKPLEAVDDTPHGLEHFARGGHHALGLAGDFPHFHQTYADVLGQLGQAVRHPDQRDHERDDRNCYNDNANLNDDGHRLPSYTLPIRGLRRPASNGASVIHRSCKIGATSFPRGARS